MRRGEKRRDEMRRGEKRREEKRREEMKEIRRMRGRGGVVEKTVIAR